MTFAGGACLARNATPTNYGQLKPVNDPPAATQVPLVSVPAFVVVEPLRSVSVPITWSTLPEGIVIVP